MIRRLRLPLADFRTTPSGAVPDGMQVTPECSGEMMLRRVPDNWVVGQFEGCAVRSAQWF